MDEYENTARSKGFRLIVGIDEAGRGPLAGPVVAAAVALTNSDFSTKICDSKKISSRQREKAFQEISQRAHIGIGVVGERVIDQMNILQATFLAMNNAVRQLISRIPSEDKKSKDFQRQVCLLIDGNQYKSQLPYAYKTIVRGDASVLSIACASIVAKVTRDRILVAYDYIFPQYGFSRHKGYPTVFHKQAIKQFGPTIIHRKSFSLS